MPSTRRESVRERHQDEPRHGHASERANAGERRYSDRLSGTGTRHDARPSRRSSDGFDNALFDDIDASIAPPKETTNRIGAVHVGSYNAYGQGLSQRNARRSTIQTRRIEPVDSHRHDPHSTHRARRSTMPGGALHQSVRRPQKHRRAASELAGQDSVHHCRSHHFAPCHSHRGHRERNGPCGDGRQPAPLP